MEKEERLVMGTGFPAGKTKLFWRYSAAASYREYINTIYIVLPKDNILKIQAINLNIPNKYQKEGHSFQN